MPIAAGESTLTLESPPDGEPLPGAEPPDINIDLELRHARGPIVEPVTDDGRSNSGLEERKPVEPSTSENVAEGLEPAGESHRRRRAPAPGALTLLVVLAILYTLYFARAVLVPIAFGIVLSLLLRPIVRWLGRRRVPEFAGAGACLLALALLVLAGVVNLIEPMQASIADLPSQLQRAELRLRGVLSKVESINKATEKFEKIASGKNDSGPLEVQVQQPRLLSSAVLLSTTGAMLASVVVVMVLTFFLLTSGDLLIKNVLSVLPTFREKRRVVELIQNVQRGVSSYLLTVTVINSALGVAVALAMWAIGMPTPMLWGLLAATLNYVPYAGPLVCGLVISLVSLLAFDSLAYATVAPLAFFAITTIEGQIVTPAFIGRRMSLNPIMVFLFLLFWGWMWGIAGAVLAVPLLAIVRIVCDQFERTQPLGTMLSG